MSGAMRKVGVYLGLLEDDDRYADEQGHDGQDDSGQARPVPVQRPQQGGATVAQLADRRPTPAPVMAELSRITTLHRAPTTRRARSASTSARASP